MEIVSSPPIVFLFPILQSSTFLITVIVSTFTGSLPQPAPLQQKPPRKQLSMYRLPPRLPHLPQSLHPLLPHAPPRPLDLLHHLRSGPAEMQPGHDRFTLPLVLLQVAQKLLRHRSARSSSRTLSLQPRSFLRPISERQHASTIQIQSRVYRSGCRSLPV